MGLSDAEGVPLALYACSATPHEVTLVDQTLDACTLDELPERLIGDKAYGSNKLDDQFLNERNVTLIVPHKKNRKRPKTQDGRPMRRYRKRWKIERLFAWLQNFRGLVVRYEYHLHNFLALIQLRGIIIFLRFLG